MLERSQQLKQALVDYVLDAEGELATALETFSATQLARSQQQDIQQRNLVIDRFTTEGNVSGKTPLELFIEQQGSQLSDHDRSLLTEWHRSFVGLFAITQVLSDGFELRNWLTAKEYSVKLSPTSQAELERFKPGEILLTRISPISQTDWMFSSSYTVMGNLGKPKLAVAIGNFKQNYKEFLYSDAPELLEEAWRSVERYHQDFLDFFGSDEVTLPGYQLGKKITEFQEVITKKQLAQAGIGESTSMAEMAQAAGLEDEELAEVAENLGMDAKAVSTVIKSQESVTKMITPKVELPPELKKAESVTVLADPRWGQMFLPTYAQFKLMLETEAWQNETETEKAKKLLRQYLEDQTINAFIWHRLEAEHSTQLEAALRSFLDRPAFSLQTDLDSVLQEFGKPLAPELPEIASVPLHLHNLFQEALAEVGKSKPKDKEKKKVKKGFL